MRGWKEGTFSSENGFHVLPINDLREHEENGNCWCIPRIEYEEFIPIYIHNSMDRREEYEQGRKVS